MLHFDQSPPLASPADILLINYSEHWHLTNSPPELDLPSDFLDFMDNDLPSIVMKSCFLRGARDWEESTKSRICCEGRLCQSRLDVSSLDHEAGSPSRLGSLSRIQYVDV